MSDSDRRRRIFKALEDVWARDAVSFSGIILGRNDGRRTRATRTRPDVKKETRKHKQAVIS